MEAAHYAFVLIGGLSKLRAVATRPPTAEDINMSLVNDEEFPRRPKATTAHSALSSNSASHPETESYRVGNKRPPKEHRWPKGTSGNPRGRRKGSLNTFEALAKSLQRRIRIERAGGSRDETCLQAMMDQAVNAALKKDWTAFKIILALLREGSASGKLSSETGLPVPEEKMFSWTEEQEELYRRLEELEREHPDSEES
jgi:hypothetical protein